MSQLLGPDGRPIQINNRKEAAPPLGNTFGRWTDSDLMTSTLPGGGVVQFDLSKLTTQDFRAMKDHYQINSSLAVLTFMQHQSQWHIECEDKKIRDAATEMLQATWTTLNRALSQANWAGFSPNVIEWENDLDGRSVVINKIKDLIPEDCRVNWKLVEGWAPPGRIKPKFKEYDGIRQLGGPWPIPTDNTLWYPILMENGNYYGKKLLKPAFQSWYFSILMHLFANRYYERFGEPVPVGRAPFEDEIRVDGTNIKGNTYMGSVLQQIRNRSVVVLPNEMSPHGANNAMEYDYQIEYLESQMRGADWERYMTRLDEEMSIGLFTPILLLRTADVGSYNLGTAHMQMYQWMLNAINDDRALYINKYLLSRWTDFNYSKKAARPRIKFRRNGNISPDQLMGLLTALVQNDKAKPNIQELGQIAGLTLEEIKKTVDKSEDASVPNLDDDGGDDAGTGTTTTDAGRRSRIKGSAGYTHTADVVKEIVNRVAGQARVQFKNGSFGSGTVTLGYKKRFEQALEADGLTQGVSEYTDALYSSMDVYMDNLVSVGSEVYAGPEDFTRIVKNVLESTTTRITGIRV